MKNEEFDFVTAMTIIAEVEKSKRRGDLKSLKLTLGEEMFKTMSAAGYIRCGFYIENDKIVDTYKPTKTYEKWHNLMMKHSNKYGEKYVRKRELLRTEPLASVDRSERFSLRKRKVP